MAQAQLEKSRHQAEQTLVTARAESEQRVLAGKGEGQRLLQIGLSEASVLMQKVASYGDPRLYALALVAEHLSQSQQPLVPQQMLVTGGSSDGAATGILGTLLTMLVAEKSGFKLDGNGHSDQIKAMAERLTREAMDAMHLGVNPDVPPKIEERLTATAPVL